MKKPDERWIVIPDWDDHVHPDAARSEIPPWIKAGTHLLSDPAFLGLSHHQRGVLLSLWLEYARSRRQLADNTATLTRQLGDRVLTRDLVSLNDAGLIGFVASLTPPPRVRAHEGGVKAKTEKAAERTEIKSLLSPPLEASYAALAAIDKPGYRPPKFTAAKLAALAAKHPLVDVLAEAEKLRDWETSGVGENQATKDGIARFRSWLAKAEQDWPVFVPPADDNGFGGYQRLTPAHQSLTPPGWE